MNYSNAAAHQNNTFFANPTKKSRYNFDSFTPDDYCCVRSCHFFIWSSKEKEVSDPD